MRRLLELIVGLFGVVGTLLCLTAIIGIWVFKSSLMDSGLMVLSPVESALGRVEAAMKQSSEMVETAQNKLKYGDPIPVAAAISREVKGTKAAVNSAYQTVSTFDQVAGNFDVVSQMASGERLTDLTMGIATHLGQFDQSFQQIEGFAQSVGEGRTEAVGQLSGELNQLQTKAVNVMAEVEKGKATLRNMAKRVPELISWGVLLLTFLFFWLGLGQFFMMLWGWRKLMAA